MLRAFLVSSHPRLKRSCFHARRERETALERDRRELDVERELDATTEAVIAGDQAHLAHLADAGAWERRGLLQKLARPEGPNGESWRRALRLN
jgi:hypothetical protein